VSNDGEVVGILCSDLHLCHTPPPARATEPSWYDAMRRVADELFQLKGQLEVPLVLAGDVFDKPNPPLELVNFAIVNVPVVHAVPGQHDLLNHVHADLHKTAYFTLVQAGVVKDINPESPTEVDSLVLHGFPWEFPLKKCPKQPGTFYLNVAVIHHYAWIAGHGYDNNMSPSKDRVSNLMTTLTGYDSVLFGDNHKNFVGAKKGTSIFNPGSLMRRHSDQKDHKPCVGLLKRDGTIEKHFLDVSQDKFIDVAAAQEKVSKEIDLDEFLEEIAAKGEAGLDYVAAVKRAVEGESVSKRTKRIVIECVERGA
jgi:DNA repair exonuclease SbcCD nuclease subunit